MLRENRVVAPHRDGMADELAAMANTAAGTIVLGVDDKTRELRGIPQEKLDIVESWLRPICNDSIQPPLDCVIRKLLVQDSGREEKALVCVEVPRSLFVHKSPNGYFRRIGSSKREMQPEVLARLFQQRSQARLIRFDEQIVPAATIENLDPPLWNRFRTVLSPKDDVEFLCKMKLLSRDEDGTDRATVGGVLLASSVPELLLPNAFIQAVCYRGAECNAAYQLDAKNITGPLDLQIREACKFVERNMRVYAVKAPSGLKLRSFQ